MVITPGIAMQTIYAFGTNPLISWHDGDFGEALIKYDNNVVHCSSTLP
jgi:hypothetical protein